MKCIMALGVVGLLASTHAALAAESSGIQIAQADTGGFVVHFPLNRATLDPAALSVISAAAQEFQRTGSARISVRGHTDTSGSSSYNQALSERREQAVANALIRQGVPADAITGEALGETDLAVVTPDGVPEAANRRVDIAVVQPPAPVAEMAPAPVPEPMTPPPAAAPPPEKKHEWLFSAGGFYGFNLEDQVGNTSHLGGINLAVDVPVLPWLSVGVEQAGFYHFDTPNDGFGGRTVASLDFGLMDFGVGETDFSSHIGGNIGYLYGSGFHDDFIAGPEIGVAAGPFLAKVAYDIPFNRGLDEGIINTTIGIRF
jgi:hypothetical protein